MLYGHYKLVCITHRLLLKRLGSCKLRDLQVRKGFCSLHFDTNCSYIIKHCFHHRTLASPIVQNVGPTRERNRSVFCFSHTTLHLPWTVCGAVFN